MRDKFTGGRHGSSPRVRGTAGRQAWVGEWNRFIPACAGNRDTDQETIEVDSVHPRVCGEQSHVTSAPRGNFGSSPRVRGTERDRRITVCFRRFIPACAGNRRVERSLAARTTVHPRVCGEQTCVELTRGVKIGSSPRVRGTDLKIVSDINRDRFIPACAGNRQYILRALSWSPVHPRVCGEQQLAGVYPSDWIGSSPRVRGTGCL